MPFSSVPLRKPGAILLSLLGVAIIATTGFLPSQDPTLSILIGGSICFAGILTLRQDNAIINVLATAVALVTLYHAFIN